MVVARQFDGYLYDHLLLFGTYQKDMQHIRMNIVSIQCFQIICIYEYDFVSTGSSGQQNGLIIVDAIYEMFEGVGIIS